MCRGLELIRHDDDKQAACLRELLTGRPAAELEDFERIYRTLHRDAHRFDIEGAGYLINKGLGDDGFVYFRAWLISRGRHVYERAMADPDSLADVAEARENEIEDEVFGYAVYMAYRDTYGKELDSNGPFDEAEPRGTRWFDEADLVDLLPRLWAQWLASEARLPREQGS